MTRRDVICNVGASGVLAMLAGCSWLLPHWTYRYRLTVEVERGGTIHSGSSVIEVRREKGPMGGAGGQATGEAVAVDLGDGNILFGLLIGNGAYGGQDWCIFIADEVFASRLGPPGSSGEERLNRLELLTGESATLSPIEYPTFVKFNDNTDPRSVEQVDPDNLARSFGQGVKLHRVYISLTNDRVTTAIHDQLPWLGTTITGYLSGSFAGGGPALSDSLDTTAFERKK